jgi:hypothetical protein
MARHDILGLEFSVVTRLNRQDKTQRVLLQSPVRAQLAYGRDAAAKRKSRLGFPENGRHGLPLSQLRPVAVRAPPRSPTPPRAVEGPSEV